MSNHVTLTVPAETTHVSLARTVAAAVAAQANLPVDQLDDVRLAVDEVVSQLLVTATAGAHITLTFRAGDGRLDVAASCAAHPADVPPTDTFSWLVLTALADSVTASVADNVVTLALRIMRAVPVAP